MTGLICKDCAGLYLEGDLEDGLCPVCGCGDFEEVDEEIRDE